MTGRAWFWVASLAVGAATAVGAAQQQGGAKAMNVVTVRTTIEPGQDKEVNPLFQGAGRRLVQITLRNGGVLQKHTAPVPITVQCIAGTGTFLTGEGGESVELKPGVLVTLEPNVPHEIRANPAVSVLLTQFTAK